MGVNASLFEETITTPDIKPSPIIIPIPEELPLPPDPFRILPPKVTPDTEPTPKA